MWVEQLLYSVSGIDHDRHGRGQLDLYQTQAKGCLIAAQPTSLQADPAHP